MAARGGHSSATLGFLTTIEDAELGLFGGYLALNAAGRPLEFHCTAPVRANRAQEILYGPALAPYLQGELIGGALLGRVKMPPLLVCTDQAPALAVRRLIEIPAVLVLADGDGSEGEAPLDPRLVPFRVGDNSLAVSRSYESDRRVAEETCAGVLADFDLAEPFARIREALQEARPSTGAALSKPPRSAAA